MSLCYVMLWYIMLCDVIVCCYIIVYHIMFKGANHAVAMGIAEAEKLGFKAAPVIIDMMIICC